MLESNLRKVNMSKSLSVRDELAGIEQMSASELRQKWGAAHQSDCPKISPSLLRLALAHEVQSKGLGQLRPAIARKLQSIGSGNTALTEPAIRLKPGTRLLREWNGRTHSVVVSEEGFEMDGQIYPSLTAVAKHITGAHWSGPRFFGLKRPSSRARGQSGDHV